MKTIEERLEEIRQILREEDISYGDLVELQYYGESGYIDLDDLELLEAAGVPEESLPYLREVHSHVAQYEW